MREEVRAFGQVAAGEGGVMSPLDIFTREARIQMQQRRQTKPEGGFKETEL